MKARRMDEARRTAYLDALGIPSWISRAPAQAETGRDAPPADVRLRVCPGIGSVLMICGDRDLTASLLADDIRRALGDDPVWAWPGESDGEFLEDVVAERLFTDILVFGEALSDVLFGQSAPATVGAARVLCVPSLDELSRVPESRRSLWSSMSDHLLVRHA